jgi:L-ascorbate metabolism protein UlaG (beta-lactamase superfamily)
VRVHEDLLYRSRHYDEALQSLRLSTLQSDARPFFMSTPSLPAQDDVHWRVPFRDSRVDDLYRLDDARRPLGEILELFDLDQSAREQVKPLLTEQPAAFAPRWTEQVPRLRLIGHACVLVEWKGVAILTDPFVPVRPAAGGAERLSYHELPERIDFAIVTHNHQDHFALETLLRLRHRVERLIVPKPYRLLYGDLSLKRLATTVGFRDVVELDELESVEFADGGITAVPFHGEHADLAHGKNGYVVRCGTQRFWFGADSDCLDADVYRHTSRVVGPIDALFVGTESVGGPLSWTNGPLLPRPPEPEHETGRRYHGCCARTALDLVRAIDAPRIYLYAMGLEPWMDHLLGLGMNEHAPQWIESERLIAAAREGGLVAERLKGPCEVRLQPAPRPAAVARTDAAGGVAVDDHQQFDW